MIEMSLMDTVITTSSILFIMALLSCIYCYCIKLSDIKMKSNIIEMATKNGVEVDLAKLESKHVCQSPLSNENCTIIVPDVGIIL